MAKRTMTKKKMPDKMVLDSDIGPNLTPKQKAEIENELGRKGMFSGILRDRNGKLIKVPPLPPKTPRRKGK
jgi:hypothetical protein